MCFSKSKHFLFIRKSLHVLQYFSSVLSKDTIKQFSNFAVVHIFSHPNIFLWNKVQLFFKNDETSSSHLYIFTWVLHLHSYTLLNRTLWFLNWAIFEIFWGFYLQDKESNLTRTVISSTILWAGAQVTSTEDSCNASGNSPRINWK